MRVERHPPYEFYSVHWDRADWPPAHKPKKRHTRKRKPSLRSVLAQSRRAGVEVGSYTVATDGSITIHPGKPSVTSSYMLQSLPAHDDNEWN